MKKIALILFCLLFFPHAALCADVKTVLSDSDKKLYREIFTLQDKEDFKTADVKIKQLQNPVLMSYIQAQRYLSKTYITSKKELDAWLRKYPHHPDAFKIYNLAVKKNVRPPIPKPQDPDAPRKSCTDTRSVDPLDLIIRRNLTHLSGQKRKEGQRLMSTITRNIIRGKTLAAYNALVSKEAKALFRPIDYDAAATALAFLYFTEKEYKRSLEVAKPAYDRSGSQIPILPWVMGLVYWQNSDYENAFKYFKEAAENPRSEPGLSTGAAYFASRAALRLKRYSDVNRFLEIAARHPQTFYGLIAERILGEDQVYTYQKPVTYSRRILDKEQKERVMALLELGLDDKAVIKLRSLYLAGHKEAEELILMLEEDPTFAGFLERSIAFGGAIRLPTGRTIYYPVPSWEPINGWQIDRALVYAFIRQESCFNKDATSKVGARGLMQLMPQTATLIANMMNLDINRKRLYEPELNIALGQKYINHLIMFPQINRNLIFIAVGYNAGPGNLIKWLRTVDHRNDPLIFIEALPSRETRGFIKSVLTNFWMYRHLLDQDNPSIDQVIAGTWPLYEEQDLKDFLIPSTKVDKPTFSDPIPLPAAFDSDEAEIRALDDAEDE